MALLQAVRIKKRFGGIQALSCGDITLEEGRILGLLGANGSGKSTMSKIICGIHLPCDGTILFNGSEVAITSPKQAAVLGIVMVHQHLSLIPELTVWENIVLGKETAGRSGFLQDRENRRIALEALSRLDTQIRPDALVRTLSPADKQLVEIAKALAQNPKILILDEPTAALEISQVNRLFDILLQLKNRDNVSMIFISHRMWEVARICDSVSVFRNGETVGHLPVVEGHLQERKVVGLITGKEPSETDADLSCSFQSDAAVRLEADNLLVTGRSHPVRMSVRKGEIVGIAGLNGQGQPQLLEALAGHTAILSGQVRIDGMPLHLKSPRDAIRAGMVMVPGDRQEEGVFLEHDILSNLVFPLYGIKRQRWLINKAENQKVSHDAMERMNIQPKDDTMKIRHLSGGNQQKVVVGKWLALSPKVLLLSDPAKGVDVNAKEEMYRVVRELADGGTAVVLYASDNEELIHVCQRVLVMFEGRMVAELCGEGLTDEQIVEASLGREGLTDKQIVEASLGREGLADKPIVGASHIREGNSSVQQGNTGGTNA